MEQHSYRSTQLIVATAYDGVCYVMGADIYETRNCFFAGIKTDVIPSYGEKAYSNEWENAIPAREMLSWQFALIDGEDLVEFIFF